MVPAGYPWLYLVFLAWLYLVIYDSNICEIVCAFAVIFSVICRNLLQLRPDKMTMIKPAMTKGNQQKPLERLYGKGASDSLKIYDLNRRIYTYYMHCFIHKRKRFLEALWLIFCKSKKFIIFNIHYRPGSKKSKFDMTLIRHSPYTIILFFHFSSLARRENWESNKRVIKRTI